MRHSHCTPATLGRLARCCEVPIAVPRKDQQIPALRARDNNILSSIAIKIACRDAVRSVASLEPQRGIRHGFESANSIASQDGQRVLRRVGNVAFIRDNQQVSIAIAIHIINGDLPGLRACRKRRPRCVAETASSISQQNRDGTVIEVRRHDIGNPIPVEICGAQSLIGTMPGRKVLPGRLQTTFAVPSSNSIWFVPQLSVTTSGCPSPSKSATMTPCGCGWE